MVKDYSLFILMLVTLFSYGQGITFQKNTSSAARKFKLVQKLNKSGDSLILATEHEKIKEVDILNTDYFETIEVHNTNAKINLKHLTIGNYVVQARIGRHWIVMYLEKRDLKANGLKTVSLNIESDPIRIVPKNTIDSLAFSKRKSNQLYLKTKEMYWVVYESKTQFASHRTMSLKYADEIYNLINQIELEINSKVGINNTLKVYEVFNKPKFMRKQLRNKDYYKRKRSEHFNVEPLYNSDEKKEDIKEF
ncbi:hypothetical protein [Winogradskyella helgolandensis]|uniref:hypothetical protein n=1 Tax=Winogradskyella helgolandensis TaxID=2697010 RepID=UPI0015C1ACFF|nr:hypothetical protein [Winogradskyella helgolandensis]